MQRFVHAVSVWPPLRIALIALMLAWTAPVSDAAILVYDGNSTLHQMALAASGLGDVFVVTDDASFIDALSSPSGWDLVALDIPSGIPFQNPDSGMALESYVDAGGLALIGWWDTDGSTFGALATIVRATFEIEATSSFSDPQTIEVWQPSHPIPSGSLPVMFPIIPSTTSWSDNGDRLTGAAGTTVPCGFAATPTVGDGAIIIGNSGRTIMNGFLADNYDASDIVPLLQNEMLFLMGGGGGGSQFVRGDANDDGVFDISDGVFMLAALFVPGAPASTCTDATDLNDDGVADISDAVFGLAALFVPGSPAPPAPHPSCGGDPSDDSLDCVEFGNCP